MLPGFISAFEHQTVPVGRQGGSNFITPEEAARLALVSESRPGFCTFGYQSLRLAQYAGLVGMGSRILEILPKVEPGDGIPEVGRGVFLRLLRLARSVKIFSDVSVHQDLRKQSLIDVFIAAFFDEVTLLVRRGLLRRYRTVEDNLALIRGRLMIERQSVANAMRIDRLACRFDELTADNVWNQYLKAALHLVKAWITSVELRRRWSELSSTFDEVSFHPMPAVEMDTPTFDRQAEYYKPAVLWAKWIIRVLSPNLRVGRNEAPGLIFDMNQLFESAIVTVLRRRAAACLSLDVGAQDTGTYLATLAGSEGKQAFRLRPDIVIREAGKVQAVGDTKWTRVEVDRSGHLMPSEAHIYQMQAYASVYPCQHFTLIYPWHDGLTGSKPTTFSLPTIGDRKPTVSIACIDVRSDAFNAVSRPMGSALDRLLNVV